MADVKGHSHAPGVLCIVAIPDVTFHLGRKIITHPEAKLNNGKIVRLVKKLTAYRCICGTQFIVDPLLGTAWEFEKTKDTLLSCCSILSPGPRLEVSCEVALQRYLIPLGPDMQTELLKEKTLDELARQYMRVKEFAQVLEKNFPIKTNFRNPYEGI